MCYYQVYVLNCGEVVNFLGEFDSLYKAFECIRENEEMLKLDFELSITGTYNSVRWAYETINGR